ncbi:MFS transporter [Paenibacillus methanolicus]|uniref:MFS transporter n=1 Tax=Paenibacillus methanolicus TaxID=582686 RepID=A0A5S5C5M5_9BACL|nr:MFS transporter [Paenibacillus methanolicus]TYP74725.1 MFS transporter [Paenibacillus methanolicus]
MTMRTFAETWKYPAILLVGIGIANVSGWIYFIALNLIALKTTGSVLAVSGLYVVRTLASLCAGAWSGSLIDRLNKRTLMIALDVGRAGLIALLPLHDAMWYIYLMVFVIQMAGAVFGPASGAYITKLIPPDRRSRFNAWNALIGSGAFLIGPAIAGLLFVAGSPSAAIYINAAALLVSGMLTLLMPNLEGDKGGIMKERMNWTMIRQDWRKVIGFYARSKHVLTVILLFSGVMVVMASAVDSLEAAFAKVVLGLSARDYGLLVSVAGAGIIAGAGVNALMVSRMPATRLIGLGTPGVCAGYFIYACSSGFAGAASGFFILAFFLAFANTGYATFYQNHIPVDLMGRIGSVNGFVEALLAMTATIAMGATAEAGAMQEVVIAGVAVMAVLGGGLSAYLLWPKRDGQAGDAV